jgi:hypothetical protein
MVSTGAVIGTDRPGDGATGPATGLSGSRRFTSTGAVIDTSVSVSFAPLMYRKSRLNAAFSDGATVSTRTVEG